MSRSEIFIHYKETLRIHNFITKTNLEFPCTNYKIYEEYIIINNKTESIIIEIKNINKLNKELKINNKEEEIKYYNFKTNELQNIDITIKNEIINVFFHEVGRLLKVYEIKEKEIKEKIFEKVYLFKTSGNYFIINFQTHLIYRTFKEELIKTNEFEFYDIFENCFMYFKNKTIIKEKKKIINESILYVYEESILKKSFIFKNKFSWIKFNFLNNQTVFIIFESQNNSTSYYGIRTLYLYENEDIKIIDIPNPIHSINILNNKSYTIIYGDQPAKCIKLNLLNNNKELLPGNNRNYVFFNNIENLAIYAGINNLPGYFEVYDMETNESIFYLKRVGVSKVIWSPCGIYFLLAITNELKVSNGYTIFDYYGREIDDLKVEDLKNIEWIGKGEFNKIERPKKLTMKKTELFTFSFPKTLNKMISQIKTEKELNNENKKEELNNENKKEEIIKQLEIIKELRNKVKTENYELTLREMNLCLQETNLKNQLEKL